MYDKDLVSESCEYQGCLRVGTELKEEGSILVCKFHSLTFVDEKDHPSCYRTDDAN